MFDPPGLLARRWWSATDRVRQALPTGARLDTWQLDAYSDEPYCENFRGELQCWLMLKGLLALRTAAKSVPSVRM